MGGFDKNWQCDLLSKISQSTSKPLTISTEYILPEHVKNLYPNLNFTFYFDGQARVLEVLHDYNIHPPINFKNFLCSFNGTLHVSRKLLTAILHRYGWANNYVSKNFTYTEHEIDGHVQDYVDNQARIYTKFFIDKQDLQFYNTIQSFDYDPYNHISNIYALESRLTESFVHLVSESMATSYVPFYGEKFLYSIVTRGLFVAYAQPGWHAVLEKYYGFKKYDKIFDYRFDSIENPIKRLVELVSMLSKFSKMSADDWKDLYRIEEDTIEFNYNHYFSKNYLRQLQKCT
jgi:hypothetical protein